jgi:DNA-binding transcriptional LysR family regulator
MAGEVLAQRAGFKVLNVPYKGAAPAITDLLAMDKLKQLESFVSVATKGSLTAAARAEGVAPAIMGRRLDALEERLGVKLLVRTTRRISLTHEGSAFLEDCQRLLADLGNAEASVSAGGVKASGHLRITAPAGFGRRHVAPLVPRFRELHADVTISLNLSDRVVDLGGEGFDCAVRVGDFPDSSLVSVRLADNRRMCVAAPTYLKRHGTPEHPNDLLKFDCLTLSSDASQTRGWAFLLPQEGGAGELVHFKPAGPLDCSDGQVLHDWCVQGYGVAWRSTWEVEQEIADGRLREVLAPYAAPPNGIYAVFPQRKHLPLRVRLWIDFLKCRVQWLNAAVVERLAQVDRVYGIAAVLVLATGVARTVWGVKGTSWYWTNPLLHVKLTLFIVVGVISIVPTLTYIRWRKTLRATGTLPAEADIQKTRKLVMVQAHLIALIPLVAVFLARGFGK